MIPKFPTFKQLELTDKKYIEKVTKEFPPYSDFNFTSLWVWNIRNTIKISTLNGNIVILFSDYVTNKKFISFIGKQQVLATTFELLFYSKKYLKKNFLKFIPEELTLFFTFKHSPLTVHQDRDDADYIYLTEHLATMDNWKKHSKGKSLRKHLSCFPKYTVSVLSLKDIKKKEFKNMFHTWSYSKHGDHAFDLNEFKAFQRFLTMPNQSLFFIAIYVDNKLAGFSAYEKVHHQYAIAHFSKADSEKYPGIYEILNWEEGRVLHAKGVRFLNWEQDLGIEGLRYAKEKYKPLFLLKKIIVSLS